MTDKYDHAINIIRNWGRAQMSWRDPIAMGACYEWLSISNNNPGCYTIDDLNDPYKFRLRPEPKPKKYVPLTRDDLPKNIRWVRFHGTCGGDWHAVSAIRSCGLQILGTRLYTWQTLFDDTKIEFTVDGETWHPFSKEVEG